MSCDRTLPVPEFIFDTTVLSNLAVVGRLDLLEKRYRGIGFTTMEVVHELRRGLNAGYAYLTPVLEEAEKASGESWLQILVPQSADERRLRAEFDLALDAGEASCLALALVRSMTFVTDDLAARQLAKARGAALTGTLGILIASVRDGNLTVDEANGVLARMIEAHYRAPVERLDDLI